MKNLVDYMNYVNENKSEDILSIVDDFLGLINIEKFEWISNDYATRFWRLKYMIDGKTLDLEKLKKLAKDLKNIQPSYRVTSEKTELTTTIGLNCPTLKFKIFVDYHTKTGLASLFIVGHKEDIENIKNHIKI